MRASLGVFTRSVNNYMESLQNVRDSFTECLWIMGDNFLAHQWSTYDNFLELFKR